MTEYLDQIAVSSRPGTVSAADLALRTFTEHLMEAHPTCRSVKAIGRAQIESYKLALVTRPGKNDESKIAVATIRHKLGMLRTFFDRLVEWDVPDAPKKAPIYAGDIPKADEPLPRFLDDPTYAKFMATLAKDTNLRRRVIVELLARTGMRAGEVGGLRDDSVFRLGTEHWLRIPVGKLHNDRTVPLHPVLVKLIDDYQKRRGPNPSGLLVVRDDGRPFDRRTIHRYVASVAKRAGVGHVHPHQLRHTLATHCINRGMSLEAIAALLGHRSSRMTLVYARISNDTVAKQYFQAIEAVERVGVVARGEEHDPCEAQWRQLANGHLNRPGFDGGCGYWIPTSDWSACWAA
jgi:integrase